MKSNRPDKHRSNSVELQRVPPRFLLAPMGDEAAFTCPRCGCDYVHLSGVEVDQGFTSTYVTNGTTQTKPSERHKHASGSRVVVHFYCEGGCQFAYAFDFNHGTTTLTAFAGRYHDVKTDLTADEWCDVLPDELWRD